MANQLLARNLVVEDALYSRGLVTDNEQLVTEERELEDDIRRTSPDRKGKGKGRSSVEYDDQDDEAGVSYGPGRRGQPSSSTVQTQRRYDDVDGNDDDDLEDGIPLREQTDRAHYHPNRRRDSEYSTSSSRAGEGGRGVLRARANSLLDNILHQKRSTGLSSDKAMGNGVVTKAELRRRWWRNAVINVAFIAAWYIFSTLISIYNKWMFSPEHYNFGFPLFVTACHMLVQFFLCSMVLSIFPTLRPKTRPTLYDWATKAIPCGLATGLDIGLSNLSLKTITLSFYTMCKSSTLGFVLLWAFIFRLEKPTIPLIAIISVITIGVILMVSSETQFHLVGMIQVLTASALSGLRWSLTQILLDKEQMGMNNPFATLFWLAPIMGTVLAFCSVVWEGWYTLFTSEFFDGLDRILWTAAIIMLPGVLAFSMNIAEFGLIQRTSVVTLSVAGIFKETATIFLSTVVFHDQLTPINISGLCVALSGIAAYNYMKYRNWQKAEKAALARNNGSALDGNGDIAEEGEMMLQNGSGRQKHVGEEDEGDDRYRHPHASTEQFALVGEHDFDSSDDDEDDDRHPRHGGPAAHRYDSVAPPSYSVERDNAALRSETKLLEQKVHDDPMLLDLDREEEQLESELDKVIAEGSARVGESDGMYDALSRTKRD